jgi:hypothetical protein
MSDKNTFFQKTSKVALFRGFLWGATLITKKPINTPTASNKGA